jgi:CheY-like chemotaxis protein
MSLQPILYAEDEENDAFFLRRAFTAAEIPHPLVVVPDGQEAIRYCGGLGGAASQPLPCLILLDLNMPIKSGIEVLEWIRQKSPIATVPVIILSSSLQPYDIQVAYSRGANAYLVKPSVPDELIAMARSIKDFWLDRNRSVPG